ncbi:hypothetical protein HDU87_000586 [Geranomyces variabilis]|uniref:mannan endo-1,4-beta-mannosidase n=1 Tax=Geranomyces variabilis TaxID=109894 RepID=A0AAD5XLR0_9FUNG|nr:hypothetical protein HDU87_000586 [Geranomyces variabilis]
MASTPRFVTRTGSVLNDPLTAQPLRFVSFNIPTLHLQDDPSFVVPTDYEQDDVLSSLAQMGGRVSRIYTLSVQTAAEEASTATTKHIIKGTTNGTAVQGPVLNERVLRGLDSALANAAKHGIRLIVPFIDRWEWWGGYESFVNLLPNNPALPASAFFTDATAIAAFKSIVGQIITRNNTVTGVVYRDDPTILGWETGNELELNGDRVPAAWTSGLAAHIKSLDPNHLVMDGSYKHGWDDSVLNDPNIDMYSNHYYRSLQFSAGEYAGMALLSAAIVAAIVLFTMTLYYPRRVKWVKLPPFNRNPNRETRIRQLLTVFGAFALIAGSVGGIVAIVLHRIPNPRYGALSSDDASTIASHGKVFIAGEFGLASSSAMSDVLENVVDSKTAFAGALVWSLRGHCRSGGFYTHSEQQGYSSYHFPGFNSKTPGFGSDEPDIIDAVKYRAATLAKATGYSIQAPALPGAPTLIPSTLSSTNLRWQGVAGALDYAVARTSDLPASAASNWQFIANAVVDDKPCNTTLYTDSTAVSGQQYAYVVRARNAVGSGPLSQPMTITAP